VQSIAPADHPICVGTAVFIPKPHKQGESVMKRFIIATALAAAIASPAFAQSYDPSVGSGNIAPKVVAQAPQLKLYNALGAYAQVGGDRVIVEAPRGLGSFADPDANIGFQLNREAEQGRW
jgi:hypothetical protein